jgi:uncharacterized protein YggE
MQAPFGLVPPGIVTTGEATVRVKPDAAVVTVGAVAQAASAQEAQAQLGDRIARVLELVRTLAIADEDTRTVGFRVEPQYAHEPGRAPRLTGYQAAQHIRLTLHGTDGIGKVLDTLVHSKAATTAAVAFTMRDRKAAEAAATAQAIQDARAKAQEMAATAGVTLGRLVSLSDIAVPGGFEPQQAFFARALSQTDAAADVPAGQLEIVVRVRAQFEID